MRLTAEDHPDTVKRYAHVKPARGRGAKACHARWPGESRSPARRRTCTREAGHRGPHVTHGSFRRILAVWDGASAVPAGGLGRRGGSEGQGRKRRRSGSPVGLPSKPSVGLVRALGNWLSRTFGSVEDVAMFIFLLAFIGFAVHWFGLLLG